MVKFYEPKRRRKFDEDEDWLPQKNRPLVLKQPKAEAEPKSESLPEGHKPTGRIKSQNKRRSKQQTRKV